MHVRWGVGGWRGGGGGGRAGQSKGHDKQNRARGGRKMGRNIEGLCWLLLAVVGQLLNLVHGNVELHMTLIPNYTQDFKKSITIFRVVVIPASVAANSGVITTARSKFK